MATVGLRLAALLNRNPMLLGASAADAATFKANAEVEYAQHIKELRNDPQVTES